MNVSHTGSSRWKWAKTATGLNQDIELVSWTREPNQLYSWMNHSGWFYQGGSPIHWNEPTQTKDSFMNSDINNAYYIINSPRTIKADWYDWFLKLSAPLATIAWLIFYYAMRPFKYQNPGKYEVLLGPQCDRALQSS